MSGGGKPHILVISLRRSSANTAWGMRIVGGSDMGTPIIITRVQDGSPSSHELRRGDIIKKISEYDARDLRHEDAQNLFRSNDNSISLVIQRDPSAATKPSIKPAAVPNIPTKAPVAGGVPTPFASANSFVNSPVSPARLLGSPNPQNRCASPIVFPPPLPSSDGYAFPQAQHGGKPHVQFRPVETSIYEAQDDEIASISNQPYRTTPLVLPGAKVKKDAVTTSYLRHHPNPMFRQAPAHYDPSVEVLMKQKVNEVLHKQFNSPIGLYSDQNIAETIQAQTGVTPLKKTLSYDPAKSETFKALQEAELGDHIQEVTVPVQHRVFSPTAQAKRTPGPQVVYQHKVAAAHHVNHTNSIGQLDENIHQSGSFKRLMYQVLGESAY